MKIDRITLAVMFVAAAFMVWAADYYTVFDDEAFSLQRYVMPVRPLIAGLWHGVEPDPPLYYILEHAWISLVGVRPLPLRGLSIIFFILGLPVIRAAGEAWYDARAGRWAVVLCGLNPMHLFFGFAARWYSLLYLCVAVLLLAAARVAECVASRGAEVIPSIRRRQHAWMTVWIIAGLAACYTNYLGIAIVGLVWLRGLTLARPMRRVWTISAAIVLVGFGPWLPAFFRELTRFPHLAHRPTEYLVCAARSGAALLTGNLASPDAWYVWAAMIVFVIAVTALALTNHRWLGGPPWVAFGVFTAGTATLALIDKYVMSFSAAFWMTIAAILATHRSGTWHRVRQVAVGSLAIGWAGCWLNFAMEERWSSLRWLDPIPDAVRKHIDDTVIVATHPSVRYYLGCMDRDNWTGRMPPERWAARSELVFNPAQALERLDSMPLHDDSGRPLAVCTIRTASIRADDAGWPALDAWLAENMSADPPENLLPDPEAALKDKLDPAYLHPAWRVVVQTHKPRSEKH